MKTTTLAFLAACLTLVGLCGRAATEPLSWAPPELEDPIVLNLKVGDRVPKMDKSRDYLVKLPSDTPWIGELNLYGGRNVVLIGGEIHFPSEDVDASFGLNEEGKTKRSHRALYLHGQTGTIHIEGVLFSGPTIREGINIDERHPNCVVQIQNLRCETITGTRAGHHADVIQTWAGPAELRIDRLTGISTYQGFFMLPNQHFHVGEGKDGFYPTKWTFRNINLNGTETSAYLLWCPEKHTFPIEVDNVWVRPKSSRTNDRDAFLWPKPKQANDATWKDVKVGTPPGGDFVPKGAAGLGYVSPGYKK